MWFGLGPGLEVRGRVKVSLGLALGVRLGIELAQCAPTREGPVRREGGVRVRVRV